MLSLFLTPPLHFCSWVRLCTVNLHGSAICTCPCWTGCMSTTPQNTLVAFSCVRTTAPTRLSSSRCEPSPLTCVKLDGEVGVGRKSWEDKGYGHAREGLWKKKDPLFFIIIISFALQAEPMRERSLIPSYLTGNVYPFVESLVLADLDDYWIHLGHYQDTRRLKSFHLHVCNPGTCQAASILAIVLFSYFPLLVGYHLVNLNHFAFIPL